MAKCPSCEAELFIQEQFFTLSEVDELEMDDPSLPIAGNRLREWGNELYHPHYYCESCEGDFGFDMQPIPSFMVGRDDEDPWSLYDVQFARLLSEICAASTVNLAHHTINVDFQAVLSSMDLVGEPERVVEILRRADATWENYKSDMRPEAVRKAEKRKEIVHEEMAKALKAIDERLWTAGIPHQNVTDNLADNIDDVVNELTTEK